MFVVDLKTFFLQLGNFRLQPVWPVKNRQMYNKVPKNDFIRKIKDFDTFTKIA